MNLKQIIIGIACICCFTAGISIGFGIANISIPTIINNCNLSSFPPPLIPHVSNSEPEVIEVPPEAIYAVFESDVENRTYYYDVFRWDEDNHIYMRLDDSWVEGVGYWWANNRGVTTYWTLNKTKYNGTGWRIPYNETVTVDEPYIWEYYTLDNKTYFGDPWNIKWINVRENCNFKLIPKTYIYNHGYEYFAFN